jgi:hypothetical protein
MKNHIDIIANWFARKFKSFATFLESTSRSPASQSKFVDLAPTDEADKAGVYSEALVYAMNNTKISNIALTGPYGSGKSSIIQSFVKKYRPRSLHISLAAFVPEADTSGGKVDPQEIERSILQQMLFGADANKLPLSRFKRIQSPSAWSKLTSLYIMLGSLALWYVFLQREDIFSGNFFTPLEPSNWFNLVSFVLAMIFLWMTLHHFYAASFGVSLKSISLKDIEIKPSAEEQESILNRHLDEIIYFFQSTNYDLVIIEDLDRFNNTDIFVTLREINSLVNQNAGVKRTIRFLYALRDDMFVNTDRTKFFEFIIPVIPIINTSNSIDMVLEQGRRLELDERLDRQFLREVSRYLNDLRLIQNIFNEYAVYTGNLEADEENLLNSNKLLAILIYKNVYPRDFEQLHRGTGVLAEILDHKEKLIGGGETVHRAEIAELEQEIEIAERQTPSDLKELRQIYAMAFIEKLPAHATSISLKQEKWIDLTKLVESEAFEGLIEAKQVVARRINGHTEWCNISNSQTSGNPLQSYQQRKAEIERKGTDNKAASLNRIRELRSMIATLRTTQLNELLRLNGNKMEDLLKGFGENGELARFLILEGHLDDTYYQYTSLFHSGRLSPNDNKFLIQIRAFVTPEPNFPIDNPKEVIAAMRSEDFRQSYVLNVKLVDTLLSDQHRYSDHKQKLFQLVSTEFDRCEDFLNAYYAGGQDVAGFLSELAGAWKGLVPAAIASPRNISHVTQVVGGVPERLLKKLSGDFAELPKFLSDNLPEILAHLPELAPNRLKCLGFEVKDLAAIEGHPGILRFMFKEGLFALTIANLEYAYKETLGETNLEQLRLQNYTTIRSLNNAVLLERIERDFELYVRDILLKLPENSGEDISAILAIVRREALDQDDLRNFLGRQTTLLPTFEGVPDTLHATLFQLHAIQPTWENCLAFMNGEGYEGETLITYLDNAEVWTVILQSAIPDGTESLPLRQLLIEASSMSEVGYQKYARALPKPFKMFPAGLKPTKLEILINEQKVTFTKESLDAIADNTDLQVLFVGVNIGTYLTDPDKFALDDSFREELLRAEIDIKAKRAVVELMNLSALANLPERLALVGPILDEANASIPKLDSIAAQALIAHARPIATQISLFNKCHSIMTDDEVRHVLNSLPRPFSEIKTGYSRPRLQNSAQNLDLVRWLNSRGLISSWSEALLSGDIKVNLKRR